MSIIPKVMSTQHPDNATPAPFADSAGVLRGDGGIEEAVDVFALGCDEQMWDSEGKEADNQVVRKLLTGYPCTASTIFAGCVNRFCRSDSLSDC